MGRLSELPTVSDPFLQHIEGRDLQRNEPMPCPRCGSPDVELPGAESMLLGSLAGFGCIMPGCGCLGVIIMGVSWYIAGVTAWPAVVILFLLGAVLSLLLTVSGRVYRCGPCEYTWSYRDVEEFKKEKQPGR